MAVLELESETINNFMYCAFIFGIVFSYWIYRLISKFIDHIIHTQQTDQYAKHFSEHSHLLSSLEKTISNAVATVESHIYIYYICTYISDTISSICSVGLSPIMNYFSRTNDNSTITSMINPLTKSIRTYLSGTKSKSKCSTKSRRNHRTAPYDPYLADCKLLNQFGTSQLNCQTNKWQSARPSTSKPMTCPGSKPMTCPGFNSMTCS